MLGRGCTKRGEERGLPEERAKVVAARTVNKRRRIEGRTPNRRTQGTANRNRPLEERTVDELRDLARERRLQGRSKMNKAELVSALRVFLRDGRCNTSIRTTRTPSRARTWGLVPR